jgi:Kef-type K+ transport system membrane component KefB
MGFETILHELVVIFAGVAVLSTLFLLLKQPIVVAYICLGMIAGPFGLRIITNARHIEHISHLGIVLLLFLIGLNLHPGKLVSLFRKTAFTTIMTCLVFCVVFGVVTFAFRFAIRDSIVVGMALMFSSTIVGVKLIPTTTLHQKHLGELMVSVLLLQDIIAILVIILLEGASGQSFYLQMLTLTVKAIGMVLLAVLLVKYCILRVFRKYDTIQEYVLVVALGWCLAVAGASKYIGLSYEIGAFIAGCTLALSPISLVISERLKSLREFFLILFFFAIGTQFDLLLLKHVLLQSVIMAIILLAVKPLVFAFAFRMSHESADKARELGFRLGQSSEFSLLVAYMATASSIITTRASCLIQLTTIITWLVSTYVVTFKYPTPIAGNAELRRD